MHPARLRDRVPGILVALGFQAGLVLLLVFSFPVVERLTQERETILNLVAPAPLPPVLPRAVVIDGRPRLPLRPSTLTPPLATAPPAPLPTPGTAQPQDESLLRDLGRKLADCRPEKLGDLPPSARALCPPPPGHKDEGDVALANPKVKDERYWEAEKANRHAPFALPGAAAGPLGILLTALFNPSAFADKHNYSYGPPLPPKDGAPSASEARQHASDTQVRDAMAAVNARKRMLYGKPASGIVTQTEGTP